MRRFGQYTLLGIIRSDVGRLHQWVKNNIFKHNSRKVKMSVSVSPPKLLKRISPHKQNHMALLPCFLNIYKRATIRQISYSQTCTSPKPSEGRVYASIPLKYSSAYVVLLFTDQQTFSDSVVYYFTLYQLITM
jgi:hypothetical protein